MNQGPDRAPDMPEDVVLDTPNAARMYDYYLGGQHNFEVDRAAAKRAIATWPSIRQLAMDNRQWMRRVVRDALATGIRQFIDLGSGVPTVGNVHEIIRRYLPETERASVVYVDYESVAATEARTIIQQEDILDWTAVIQRDMRQAAEILTHPDTLRLIDFSQPVSLQMIAVLHFLGPEDDPHELVATYRDRLAPGSRLSISHVAVDDADPEDAAAFRRIVEQQYRKTQNPAWLRDKDEFTSFFGDWQMVEPGVVHIPDWKTEPESDADSAQSNQDARLFGWCGVAENRERQSSSRDTFET